MCSGRADDDAAPSGRAQVFLLLWGYQYGDRGDIEQRELIRVSEAVGTEVNPKAYAVGVADKSAIVDICGDVMVGEGESPPSAVGLYDGIQFGWIERASTVGNKIAGLIMSPYGVGREAPDDRGQQIEIIDTNTVAKSAAGLGAIKTAPDETTQVTMLGVA